MWKTCLGYSKHSLLIGLALMSSTLFAGRAVATGIMINEMEAPIARMFSTLDEFSETGFDWQTDSAELELVGRWPYGPCFTAAIQDRIAVYGNGSLLEIVDLSDATQPVPSPRP